MVPRGSTINSDFRCSHGGWLGVWRAEKRHVGKWLMGKNPWWFMVANDGSANDYDSRLQCIIEVLKRTTRSATLLEIMWLLKGSAFGNDRNDHVMIWALLNQLLVILMALPLVVNCYDVGTPSLRTTAHRILPSQVVTKKLDKAMAARYFRRLLSHLQRFY